MSMYLSEAEKKRIIFTIFLSACYRKLHIFLRSDRKLKVFFSETRQSARYRRMLWAASQYKRVKHTKSRMLSSVIVLYYHFIEERRYV